MPCSCANASARTTGTINSTARPAGMGAPKKRVIGAPYILRATRRPSRVSRAMYTVPMPTAAELADDLERPVSQIWRRIHP
jgi:hypothetical protein